MELRSSKDWLKEFPNIVVYDPDGWDRKNFKQSWNEPITKEEFEKRLSHSTCLWNYNNG